MTPRRNDDVLEVCIEDQLLLMHLGSAEILCLNPPAAAVYRACDGAATGPEIVARLTARIAGGDYADDYAVDEAEAIVETTLFSLAAAGLVETALPERRRFLIGAGRIAAFAALISSTMAPRAADATSGCLPPNDACYMGGPECCEGECNYLYMDPTLGSGYFCTPDS